MSIRIAVVANCQVGSYARCLGALAPDAEVVSIPLAQAKGAEACEAFAAEAAACDIVFSQDVAQASLGPLGTEALKRRCPTLNVIPKVVFRGFHPDAAHVVQDGAVQPSPTSPFNSRIAIAGFLAGLNEARTIALYNRLIFGRLGYMDAHDRARALLLAHFESLGFVGAEAYAVWNSGEAFMHSPNHPKLSLIAELAAAALDRAGFAHLPLSAAAGLADPLARAPDWPVYPELAQRLGVRGGLEFRRHALEKVAPLSLAEFVAQSFVRFRAIDTGALNDALDRRAKDLVESLRPQGRRAATAEDRPPSA